MSVFLVDNPRQARVWLNEFPKIDLQESGFRQERLSGSGKRQRRVSKAAIEVCFQTGARFRYGLLGAEFLEEGSNDLVIQVPTQATNRIISEISLADGVDQVRCGIPSWAIDGIFAATLESPDILALGNGYLRYTIGAYGEIGSSVSVFANLARSVVECLMLEESGPASAVESIIRYMVNTWNNSTRQSLFERRL